MAKRLQGVEVLVNWGPFYEKKIEKVSQCRKNWKGDPLVSPGNVCYAREKEKPFWFSSLGQQIQFKICRPFGRTIFVTSGVSKKNTHEKP